MDHLVLRTVLQLIWLAVIGLLLRWAFGTTAGLVFFGAAVAGLLIYHMRHVALLAQWLGEPTPGQVPRGSGIWDRLFALLYRYERVKTREHQQLAKTLVRYRQAGRAHPDGVVILDAENRIDWCNDVAEHHFDLNLESDQGQPIGNLLRQPEFISYLESADYAHPLELRSARTTSIIISVQVVPYGDAQKLLLSRDVTRLEKLEHMRRDFVANVSHEIRTPLTVLAGFVETMQTLKLSAQEQENYLALMATQSQRMQSLVDDLLTLSRLEGSPIPSFSIHIVLSHLMDVCQSEAQQLSQMLFQDKISQVIVFETAPDIKDILLLGEPRELQSALSNLVSNAVRYTPEGSQITLRWSVAANGSGCIEVEDDGDGFDVALVTQGRGLRGLQRRARHLRPTGLPLQPPDLREQCHWFTWPSWTLRETVAKSRQG